MSERYCNAQLSREIEIALPVELSRDQNISLVRRFVKEQFVTAGMCADICVHDTDGTNPHAHIMLTMRPIEKDGKWGQKSYTVNGRKLPAVDWNDRDKAEEWRRAWAAYCNTALRINGHDAVVDNRSYERQGIEQVPTVHMGVAATQMERRGIRTERGDMNRAIEITNNEIRQLRARITKLEKWIAKESVKMEQPSLADVITEILHRQGQSGLTRIRNAAEVLVFLQRNDIYDMEDLERKVDAMQGDVHRLLEDMKPLNRRIGTLKEHIRQSENYKEHRKLKRQYDVLYTTYTTARNATGFLAERKAKKALEAANDFYESNRAGLILFDSAEKYLRDVLQERFDPKKRPPITKWRDELAAKAAKKETLYREYTKLKEETANVERIKRSITEIFNSEIPRRTPAQTHGVEL
jgi:TolA-binding protein